MPTFTIVIAALVAAWCFFLLGGYVFGADIPLWTADASFVLTAAWFASAITWLELDARDQS